MVVWLLIPRLSVPREEGRQTPRVPGFALPCKCVPTVYTVSTVRSRRSRFGQAPNGATCGLLSPLNSRTNILTPQLLRPPKPKLHQQVEATESATPTPAHAPPTSLQLGPPPFTPTGTDCMVDPTSILTLISQDSRTSGRATSSTSASRTPLWLLIAGSSGERSETFLRLLTTTPHPFNLSPHWTADRQVPKQTPKNRSLPCCGLVVVLTPSIGVTLHLAF